MASVCLHLLTVLGMSCAILALTDANRQRRSIDLSAAHTLIADTRLSNSIVPDSYILDIRPHIEESKFGGNVRINVTWHKETNQINLHVHSEVEIEQSSVTVTALGDGTSHTLLKIGRWERLKKPMYVIYLEETVKEGRQAEIQIRFSGTLWNNAEGIFKGQYVDKQASSKTYIATHFRPNNARRLFPCFDEPGFKVPFTVSISRPEKYTTLFNTPVASTDKSSDLPSGYVVDHFEKTPPISTFTLGFIISDLKSFKINVNILPETITIWAREEILEEVKEIKTKIYRTLKAVTEYFGQDYPLKKLDIVALPGFNSVKPADNWGLIVMKESEILSRGYYTLAQEFLYQWLGSWVTPFWWSDAHVNKAIVGFLAANTALEIDDGQEFDGKWPMTILYSIYYEFSKRYPHSRITAMKQETLCGKTELVLRMLNYTLSEQTFRHALQKFMADRKYKTFYADDVWNVLTQQAHADKTLAANLTVNAIAESWITKDRLPVVTITRNYAQKTAIVTQRVYLRERPHDVPEQDKMLWVIPLIVMRQDNLCLANASKTWMIKERQISLNDMPAADQFIIVNPEEIGPFPVNYDKENWKLLAKYLQTQEGRSNISTYTRAKLLHDAWNLAYGGHLSFDIAFDMTLFLKWECDHLVWNPVFTMIDHIGRHIDMSSVHKKFETYVRLLLTPLYEDLGPVAQLDEAKWKDNLRTLAKTFLCRAGYLPCIEEAQQAFKKWMDDESPDAGNPVPNQYICPVFKWGTEAEWAFGLQRVINFPATRKKSERTYLLKTLAGCPVDTAKIERLLNITILEENGNFTEGDIMLIFSMLSSGSSGYTTLFHFLSDHWDEIKIRFEGKTSLWDNLISSATGVFTTQDGYDMVSKLYVQRQGEFESAEHIIEKSLRNIKEETKWSAENLPVIEKWLDDNMDKIQSSRKMFLG